MQLGRNCRFATKRLCNNIIDKTKWVTMTLVNVILYTKQASNHSWFPKRACRTRVRKSLRLRKYSQWGITEGSKMLSLSANWRITHIYQGLFKPALHLPKRIIVPRYSLYYPLLIKFPLGLIQLMWDVASKLYPWSSYKQSILDNQSPISLKSLIFTWTYW